MAEKSSRSRPSPSPSSGASKASGQTSGQISAQASAQTSGKPSGKAPGGRRPRPGPEAPTPPERPSGADTADKAAAGGAELPLAHQLSRALFALHSSRVGDAQKLMDEFGLSPTQMRLLVLMDPHGESTMSQAAQAAFCEPSNLTGVVDKLEARGLLKRSHLATDRRVKIITMTRAGRAVRSRLFARMYEPAPWMLALSERDQQDLLAILRRGLAYLEAIATPTLKE